MTAYLLLGAATWAWSLTTQPHDLHPATLAFAGLWAVAAIGLALRKRLGLAVLLLIELWALFGWVEDPGDWLRFGVQVALVGLLVAPPIDRYAPVPPTSNAGNGRTSIALTGSVITGALVIWAAVEAIDRDPAAVPLVTLAIFGFVIIWGALRRDSVGRHS